MERASTARRVGTDPCANRNSASLRDARQVLRRIINSVFAMRAERCIQRPFMTDRPNYVAHGLMELNERRNVLASRMEAARCL